MGVAEIDQKPLSSEIGVGDRLAVLVDEVEGTADRAAEQASGNAPRAFLQLQSEKGAGPQNDETGQQPRGQNEPGRAARRQPVGLRLDRIGNRELAGHQCGMVMAGPVAPSFSTGTDTIRTPAF